MKKIPLLTYSLSLAMASNVFAKGNELLSTTQESTLELEQVTVIDEHADNNTNGVQILDAHQIESTPTGNANLDSLVRNNPAVQFNNGNNASELAGEIAPSNLSFHGEHFYNNQFSIDGISNTSNLNPAHNGSETALHELAIDSHTPNKLPEGHTQAFWISNNLVESVDIHDSNISARYGRFTGGAVDAQLLKAHTDDFSGKISYRHSNDHLTNYYVDNAYKDEFNRGEASRNQPRFKKHQFHVDVNAPINENTALLMAYDREESFIPVHHSSLKKDTKQNRRAETFYLNLLHEPNAQNSIDASLLYSPHKGTYFPVNVKNGKFSNIGGGWRADINWKNANKWGELGSTISYRNTEETTDYKAKDLYRYISGTPSIDWVTDPEWEEATKGGLGKTKLYTKNVTLKQDMEFNPVKLGASEHKLSAGWHYEYGQSGIRRNHHSIIRSSDFTDEHNCFDCIPGEQFFYWKGHNYPVDAKVSNSSAAIWLEDSMKFEQLTLNLGARVDYNQFLKNTNLAPRLNLNYDFSNNVTVFGGLNRYYGTGILDYQLRSKYKDQDNYTRYYGDQPWEHDITLDDWGFGTRKMKTPYSDEINLGIKQDSNWAQWQGKWVRRFSRDQFMTDSHIDDQGRTVHRMNNKGRGIHDTLSLSVGSSEPLSIAGADISWGLGADYQKHSTNQQSTYEQTDWDNLNVEKVIVDGKLYNPKNMPAVGDFTRPWGAFITTEVSIPKWNLTWNQNIRYEKGRTFYDNNRFMCEADKPECQGYEGRAMKFDGVEFNDSFITDWQLAWKPLNKEQNFAINLDILNVFNRKIVGKKIFTDEWEEKKRDVSYQAGRQFWLGMEYKW